VLPEKFAASEPRRFELPAEWAALEARYAPLGESDTLRWVYQHVREQEADAALLEHEYIDGDYRDEYANFYIKVFRNLPDRCERLHFWAGKRYLGYCSIRPVPGQPVCRTMLDPGPTFEEAVSCIVAARAQPYGRKLVVPAFPFISQDRQYGRCAHAVLWMVSHYHHLLHDTPAHTMSDIVNAAAEDETERVVPSAGLTEEQIGSTLRRIGLSAAMYRVWDDGDALLDEVAITRLVRRYLNSRIPVVLGTPGHLTALIGARATASGSLEFIRSDDERGAYCPQQLDLDPDSRDRWTTLFVPLPGRIYLLGDDAVGPAGEMLHKLADHPAVMREIFEGRVVQLREYVVDSREYKHDLQQRGLPAGALNAHLQVSCPRWIWVVEIQDEQEAAAHRPCCLGEIAIDATSDGRHPNFLFANLPGIRASWDPHDPDPVVIQDDVPDTLPYRTGTALGL
jgi:hypothetical protein